MREIFTEQQRMIGVTDLFGRSASQIRASIAEAEKKLSRSSAYGGPADGQRIGALRANLECDRRQLHLVERGLDPKSALNDRAIRTTLKLRWPELEYRDSLEGQALRDFRRWIVGRR